MTGKPSLIFINQAAAYLTIDILNAFIERYNCILYTGKLIPLSTNLHKDVKVVYLKRYDNSSGFSRIFSWSLFTIQVFFKLISGKGNADLFIVSNPPTAPMLGYLFNKLKKTKYHLLIYDVYPDALVSMKMIGQKNPLTRIWSGINHRVYKHADSIFTLSIHMASLIKNYYRNTKVEIVPNWADSNSIKPIEKSLNHFAVKYSQVDKLTFMYSGNMGATHAIERIAELAAKLVKDDDVNFFLVGEGSKKQLLQQIKDEKELHNLYILPYQPAGDFTQTIASADFGIVTLSAGAENLSVPSKTYNLLAAGVPLFVMAAANSELARLVNEYDCGVHFEEHEISKMIDFINYIKKDNERLLQLKSNAFVASRNFTPANAQQYLKTISRNSNVSQIV